MGRVGFDHGLLARYSTVLAALFAAGAGLSGCRAQPATGPEASAGATRDPAAARGFDRPAQLSSCGDALEPARGCARDGSTVEACEQLCLSGDAPSCLELVSRRRELGGRVAEVLDAACAREPGCGCTLLGAALLWTEDRPDAWLRGIEVVGAACARGVLEACDEYELILGICHYGAQSPLCEQLHAAGYLPEAPPWLSEAYGCRRSHSSLDPGGPQLVVCVASDRVSVRADGRWDQWRVGNWMIEYRDGAKAWVGEGLDGGEGTGVRLIFAPRRAFSTADGGLQVELQDARDAEAERELAALASVEEVCSRARVCELERLARPEPLAAPSEADAELEIIDEEADAELEIIDEGPAAARLDGPEPLTRGQTWQTCHRRWATAARARLVVVEFYSQPPQASLPPACGTVRIEEGPTQMMDVDGEPVITPPYRSGAAGSPP